MTIRILHTHLTMIFSIRAQAAFSHWILFSQTEMRADLPRVQTRLGVSSS